MEKKEIKKINIIDFIIDINKNLFADTKEDNEISELSIHKILYIIYGNFYSKFQWVLFNANFEAWRYGPVEINFRKYFNKKNKISYDDKLKIHENFNVNLNNEEKDFLFEIIERLLHFSPWTLVHYTHSTDPWLNNAKKHSSKIPIEEIWKWFKNNKLY